MDNMRELVISGDTYRSSDAMLSQQEERMLESSSVQTIVRAPFLPSRCKRAMIHVAIVNLRRAIVAIINLRLEIFHFMLYFVHFFSFLVIVMALASNYYCHER